MVELAVQMVRFAALDMSVYFEKSHVTGLYMVQHGAKCRTYTVYEDE